MKTFHEQGMRKLLLLSLLFFNFIFVISQNQTPAFPTAEGYGMWVSGGRGGQVVAVTNLLDDGIGEIEGSLRWALNQYPNEPLTIVFRTSGIIDLNGNDLRCKRENYTIAGQTAPGDGICIKGGCLNLGGSRNIIIRHIRSRVGVSGEDKEFIDGACLNIENGGNFIVDHCSFSWSAEENIGLYDNDNTTVQWCIMAEGLYNAGHGKGARSYGAVVGGKTATYHHNLIAHNVSRSPRFGATTKNDRKMLLDYVNNVHYNWGGVNSCYGGDNRQGKNGEFKINIVNNYFKPGPAYPATNRSNLVRTSWYNGQGEDECFWHLDGNYMEGEIHSYINEDNYKGLNIDEYKEHFKDITIDDLRIDHIEVPYPVTTQTAHEAYEIVLANVGAFPRDEVDERIIYETSEGIATAISSFKNYTITGIVDTPEDSGGYCTYETYDEIKDEDGDGMDDEWEWANELDPTNPEDRNLITKEGYTALEVYLNSLVGEYIEPVFFVNNIESTNLSYIRILSNPSSDKIIITSETELQSVMIYTIDGKTERNIVATGGLNIVDIDNLSTGSYIVIVSTRQGEIKRQKVIKY